MRLKEILSEPEADDLERNSGSACTLVGSSQSIDKDVKMSFADAKAGGIVKFGRYPQDIDGWAPMPIEWRVLCNSGSELFLLSEYILDVKRYHKDFVDTSWGESDIRRWLNGEFYANAFNGSEKQFIKATYCMDNGRFADSEPTADKVFLLSVQEAREYTFGGDEACSGARRRSIGTGFSMSRKADGCRLYVYDKKVKEDYIEVNGEPRGCSWWWLRTQPEERSRAYFVGARSSIRSYGRVNLPYYGVRPALKIDLESCSTPR